MKPYLTWIAILLVGIVLGRLLPDGASSPAFEKQEDFTETHRPQGGTEYSDIPTTERSLQKGPRASGPREAEVPHERSGAGRGMVVVPEALLEELSLAAGTRTIGQDLFADDDPVVRALKITEDEKEVIQAAWQDSRQKVRDLEVRSKKTEQVDKWTMRITVPDLSQSMPPLKNEFSSSMHRALGAQRSQAFLAAKQIGAVFSPPEGARVYEVTSEAVGDGDWRLRMTANVPGGNRVWVGKTIPLEISHLTGELDLGY